MTKKWYSLFSGRGGKTKNFTSKNMKLKKKKMPDEVSQQKNPFFRLAKSKQVYLPSLMF